MHTLSITPDSYLLQGQLYINIDDDDGDKIFTGQDQNESLDRSCGTRAADLKLLVE